MGVANVLETDEIGAIDVVVTLNGEVRSDIQCTSVEWGLGTAGSTATFVAGGRRWEELRGIVGAEVGVSVDGLMVFLGVVTGRTGAATGSDNTLALRATSFVGMMDTVYIGQGRADEEIEFYYPRFAIRDGAVRETGWNIKTILRDIFSSSTPTWRGGGARLPAGWRSKVELGTMSALDKSYNQFPLEDITFRLTTLTAGIEQLLGLVGTVSFRERFTQGAVYLDFFELGDDSAPARPVRVARQGEKIHAVNANVLTITRDDSIDAVRSRVIGCGDRRRFVISVTTNHPTAPLRKGWSPAGEAAVLANPARVKRYVNTLSEADGLQYDHVFRRYLLPDFLRGELRSIAEKNAIFGSDGAEIPIQVWKIPRTLIAGEDGNYTSELATVPEILEGAKLDLKSGVITVSEPAINEVSTTVTEGANIVTTYEPATVGVTLTVGASRLTADSGIDGPVGVADGMVQQIFSDSFIAKQFNGVIDGHTFSSCWYFDPILGPQNASGALPIANDAAALRLYAALAQREMNRARVAYNIGLPFFTGGYRVGDRIAVIGEDGFDYGTHQVKKVGLDLTSDHQTSLSTDNEVPLIYQDLGVIK